MSLAAMIVRMLLLYLVVLVLSIATVLLVGYFHLSWRDAILAGSISAALLGLASRRWRASQEFQMDKRRQQRLHFPVEAAEFHLAIDQRGGRITMPDGSGQSFDLLYVDLRGDTPQIAILTRRVTREDPPTVA